MVEEPFGVETILGESRRDEVSENSDISVRSLPIERGGLMKNIDDISFVRKEVEEVGVRISRVSRLVQLQGHKRPSYLHVGFNHFDETRKIVMYFLLMFIDCY